jgi:hypothetical protein
MRQLIDRTILNPFKRKNKPSRDYPHKNKRRRPVHSSFAKRLVPKSSKRYKFSVNRKKVNGVGRHSNRLECPSLGVGNVKRR